MSREKAELVIVGGGPAGLAAAEKARAEGVKDILLLERNPQLGGILNQCIHDGFGVLRFGEAMSGPEYANRFISLVKEQGICVRTDAMVTGLTADKTVSYVDRAGVHTVEAGAVILSTGCRERTRGAVALPGDRPAGVYTAGVVQYLMNIRNLSVGKRVVILGSGDIGLIMARRLTLEGAQVLCVLEKLPYCSGLARNVRQCLEDFNIPLYLAETVSEIRGDKHVTSVIAQKVDEKGAFIPGTRREIECDTLILSVGLIPENEIAKGAGVKMDPVTGGALVDGDLMTSVEGVFSCGNGLHVHDLVDLVSAEGERAAQSAAAYLKNGKDKAKMIPVRPGDGVRYVLPRTLKAGESGYLSLRFNAPGENKLLTVTAGGQRLYSRKLRRALPAQMLQFHLEKIPENAEEVEVTLQ